MTIGVEVEKSLQTVTGGEVALPQPDATAERPGLLAGIHRGGRRTLCLYEWKSTVYCTTETSPSALPNLIEVTGAQFRAALTTLMPPSEAAARGLTDLALPGGSPWPGEDGYIVENDWGTWIQRLTFYFIPADGEPLVYRDSSAQEHIHLNLFWDNLPDIASCPVLVWDPTFQPLYPLHTLHPLHCDTGLGPHLPCAAGGRE